MPRCPHRRLAAAYALLAAALLLAACAAQPPAATAARPVAPDPAAVAWLERVTYGIDAEALDQYQRLGAHGYLAAQLGGKARSLPAAVTAQIDQLDISHADGAALLESAVAERKRIQAIEDPSAKEDARKALNERGNHLAYEATRRQLLRAIYSPDQLREQMVWFWLNHFSVHLYKANVRWLVADYEERAIRPHVFGRFRDLVLATLTHPAMLEYLDNARNAAGHINENYARELMELHTLGVDGGYTQDDVQSLARILTGVGIRAEGPEPRLRRDWQPLYRRAGAFEFNPARHDFSTKRLLGETVSGRGFGEVEQAVDLLVRQPACARFVARRLAVYFVADEPGAALVDRLADTFRRTDGDIAAVLRTLFTAPEFRPSPGTKFKDPMHYVVSAIRLAYDGQVITNSRPLLNWLRALGEVPWGRQTPDGYPLDEAGWASSGQLTRRFEIARAIGSGAATLFDTEDGTGTGGAGFPQLAGHVYFDTIEPRLGTATRQALAQARSQADWNTFLLSSPEFNYR
ncbi:MAG: DUF1800 domain-containing protein [Proteobacteria bacterium]|nr:DUF1800 domain-containing protein [Pseudomonadota bacterium]